MRRPNDTRWAQSGRTERGAPFGCYCTSPACTSSPSAECQVTCKYTKQLPWTMDHDIKQMTLEDTAGSGQASDNETRLDWEKRRSASSRQYGRHLQQQTETARGNVTLRPGHVDLEDPFAETSHSTVRRGISMQSMAPITGGDNDDTLLQVYRGKTRETCEKRCLLQMHEHDNALVPYGSNQCQFTQ